MPPKETAAEVLDSVEDTPEAEGGARERSTIAFPYLDLDDAVQIAKGVHAVGGANCQWDQLAAHIGAAAKGGAFRARVANAKLFGYLTYDRGTVMLTDSGKRLSDADQEKTARVEGFLAIPLYNKVYEQFKGGTLPPPAGLETAMVNMGVAQKQKDKARQVFQRSAQQAGFFQYGNTKLVMPPVKTSPAAPPPKNDESNSGEEKLKNGGGDGGSRHPLIEGLLRELPAPKSEWTTEDRKNWLEMASSIFNVVYKNSDDSRGSLRVVVEKSSAKQ